MLWNIGKRKRKRFIFHSRLLACWPNGPASFPFAGQFPPPFGWPIELFLTELSAQLSGSARVCPLSARGPSLLFLRFVLGRDRRPSIARARAPHLPSWFPVADTAGLFVRVAFLLKSSHRRIPSLPTTNPASKSSLPYLERLWAIKPRVPRITALIHPFCSVSHAPVTPPQARNPISPPPSASPSRASPSVHSRLRFRVR
jgi:hypothetical protein